MNLLVLSPYVFGSQLTWYSVIMLVGALIAYGVSDYFYKKEEESKKCPDLLFNTFLIAFPAGLLGGRIWYILSEWEYYSSYPIEMLKVWEGGLAIQGGVILGIAAGALYVSYKLRKHNIKLSLTRMMDIVIPNILIAQVIGRWGNFFNREVYGACVTRDKLSFLPNFILEQMAGDGLYSWGGAKGPIACAIGEYAQPLFLYEGILNFIGFILITFVLRKWFTKRIDGTLSGFYMIWYGTVRACLEGLRNERFIMRWGSLSQSVITSIAYVVIGMLFIVLLYVFKYMSKKASRISMVDKQVIKIGEYSRLPNYYGLLISYIIAFVGIFVSIGLWEKVLGVSIGLIILSIVMFIIILGLHLVDYLQKQLDSRAIVFDEENNKIKIYKYTVFRIREFELEISAINNIYYRIWRGALRGNNSQRTIGTININKYSLFGITRIDSTYDKLIFYTKKDRINDVETHKGK